jgi:hypothetical protein
MSAKGTTYESPNTWGDKHWTHRRPDRIARGERGGHAKLTEEQVAAMRALRAKEGAPIKTLGQRFGIDRRTAGDIIRRKTWRHV